MLTVITPEEALRRIETAFGPVAEGEPAPLSRALGRVLAEDLLAAESVPDFSRSTVDGYALRASDSFGCSDSLPALLRLRGAVRMGEGPGLRLGPGECASVPTGGALPEGADAVQMLEYAEDYGDGLIGILKPAAPGHNLIVRGEDAAPGKRVLSAGRRLSAADLGALAALGVTEVPVRRRLRAAVLSTGDELVPAAARPGPGQMRDVNGPMLAALLEEAGAVPLPCGIVPDDEAALRRALEDALAQSDLVVLSGGSSVGEKDAAARVLSGMGELLFHGLAMKPGKPTLLARVGDRPVLGLPGHPAAALLCARLLGLPLLYRLEGRRWRRWTVPARLCEAVPANHGRAQYMGVLLRDGPEGLTALPVHGKSGLITALAGTDGWFCVPRDCEGYPAGTEVAVAVFHTD